MRNFQSMLLSTLLLFFCYAPNCMSAFPIADRTSNDQAWLVSEPLQIDNMNISGITINKDWLFLASDEGNQIEVLKRTQNQQWQFHSLITLTNNPNEIDIEALAWQAPYLYALGSHSAKRKKIKAGLSEKENIKRLQKVYPEPDRQQLFRIELDNQSKVQQIESLSLTTELSKHPILKSFVGIPSKENGIDIEGLAIDKKSRLLLGFRGPVLRGNIAIVLRVQLAKKAFKIKKTKTLYFNAQGRGVRGLSESDQGILVLAGPVGDQLMSYQVYLWDGKNALNGKDQTPNGLQYLCDLPDTGGKPEGIEFIKFNQNSIEFVVVNDGLTNGKPTQFQCPLP
ncbi:MAG TPA: DUF3616 domain-containing protein [Thiomicrospira sp.]|nr:DUF3616 domain-containing protein [Thiomicrospira sp.]